MKRILLVTAMTFALPALILCQTGGANADKKAGGEQAVRQAISDLTIALQNNDLAALDRIYADDYTFVGDTGTIMSKSERLGALRSGDLKYQSLSTEILKINMYGDSAAALARITTKLPDGGKFNDGTFIVTLNFVKVKGRWQLVLAGNSRVPN
jgi:ketosteroid isomerase-like protein